MDIGGDSAAEEMCLQSVAHGRTAGIAARLTQRDYKLVPYVCRWVVGELRKLNERMGNQCVICRSDCATAAILLRKRGELYPQHSRLDRVEAAVVAGEGV